MRAVRLTLGVLLVAAAAAAGPAVKPRIVLGPYLTGIGADRVTVAWQTNWLSDCHLEVCTPLGKQVLQSSAERETFHRITVTALPPGSRCSYRVIVDSEPGPVYGFSTAPRGPAPFRFAAYGDTHGRAGASVAIVRGILAHSPAFVIHTGDYVTSGQPKSAWARDFFLPTAALLCEVPIVPACGNQDVCAPEFRHYFGMPAGGNWFVLSYGGADVFVLDSNAPTAPDSPQYEWLAKVLAASRARWKVAAFHHPLYSGGLHGGDDRMRHYLAPLFWKHGVDLVLVGHDHWYERTVPIGTGSRPGANCFVQIVTGGGGAKLYGGAPGLWTAKASRCFHFCIVDVADDRLTVTAYGEDDRPFDQVVLTRPDGSLPFEGAIAAETIDFLESACQLTRLRFPYGGPGPSSERYHFTFRNPYPSDIEAKLAWQVRDGAWAITPAQQSLRVPAGGKVDATFTARFEKQGGSPSAETLPLATLTTGGRSVTVPAFSHDMHWLTRTGPPEDD